MQRKHQKGFTLIEMLVVVSIISSLSSVILASVKSARQKALNKQSLSVASEYRNAIELYRMNDPNGGLPNPGSTSASYCLGTYPTTHKCGWKDTTVPGDGNWSESAPLQTALSPYLPTLPTAKRSDYVDMGWKLWYFDGPIYTCDTLVNGICTKATMTWVYGNTDYNCLGDPTASTIGVCTQTFE